MAEMAPNAGQGTTANDLFRKTTLLLLFLYIATPFDFIGATPGLVVAIQCAASLAFLSLFLASGATVLNRNVVTTAAFVIAFLLLINLQQISNYAFMAFWLIFWAFISSDLALGECREEFTWVVKAYLVVHLVGMLIAQVVYQTSGQLVDIHQILFPMSAARLSVQLGLARPSGFHIEPGTYSNWMYMAVVLHSILARRILSWLHTFVILSSALSFSAWAGVGAAFYFAAAGLETVVGDVGISFQRYRMAVFALLGIILAAVYSALNALQSNDYSNPLARYILFLEIRFSRGAGGGSYIEKLLAMKGFTDSLGSVLLFGRPIPETYCPACNSPQDLGVWAVTIFHFGLIPFVVLVGSAIILTLRRLGVAFLVLGVPIFLTKADFYDPLFLLTIACLLFYPAPSAESQAGAQEGDYGRLPVMTA